MSAAARRRRGQTVLNSGGDPVGWWGRWEAYRSWRVFIRYRRHGHDRWWRQPRQSIVIDFVRRGQTPNSMVC